MIVFDECQHATSKTYMTLFENYPNTYFLGLTATPVRLTGKPLGDIFEKIVQEIEAEDLIKLGFLANYEYYAPKLNADFTKVKISKGDFDKEEIEKELTNSTVYGNIINYYKKFAEGKKTIVYCPTISYSEKIEKLFTDNGYSARHFDGTTNDNERKEIIEDFRNGKIKILTNVDLIGEGFDVPDCECVLLLRPTQSLSLYIQQSTRCLRPNDDKKAIIIDYVGNCFRHGMPTEKREWSLEKAVKSTNKSGEEGILIRRCPKCYKVFRPPTRICPYCNYEVPKTERELKEEQQAELERIEKIEKKKKYFERKNEIYACKTFEQLLQYGKEHNYKNPAYWASMILRSRKNKYKK